MCYFTYNNNREKTGFEPATPGPPNGVLCKLSYFPFRRTRLSELGGNLCILRIDLVTMVLFMSEISINDDEFSWFCLPISRAEKRVTTQTCTRLRLQLKCALVQDLPPEFYDIIRILVVFMFSGSNQLLPYFDPRIMRCDTSFNVFSLTERSGGTRTRDPCVTGGVR